MMYYDSFPFITDGIVKDTEDPQQNGRVKIWCPALDGEEFDIDLIPWAEYATPFGGVTNDFNAGRNKTKSQGPTSYGFWALPKMGAQVLVFLLNGDPSRRFYFASYYGLHRNRSLPGGRNKNESGAPGPFTDTYDPLQPAYDNMRTAFQGNMGSPQAKSRGWFQRQVAQDKTDKDGKDGYEPNPVDGKYLDPQSYCFVTPGHHMFVMDDSAHNARIRLKTCEGNQVIIDDSNERIYVSTAKGKTWIELDEDGHIHVFGSQSVSLRAGKDVNIYADRDINLEAGNNINTKSVKGTTKITAKGDIHIRSEASILQTGCDEFHICATNGYYVTAKDIHQKAENSILNTADGGNIDFKSANEFCIGNGSMSINMTGGSFKLNAKNGTMDFGSNLTFGANTIITRQNGGSSKAYSPFYGKRDPAISDDSVCAEEAEGPSVVPGHEPWKRPASAKQRNKYWSE
jgi:phage gp45-like